MQIHRGSSEAEMCRLFLEFIDDPRYQTIAIGFNASQAREAADAYDLPFICDRAGLGDNYFITGTGQWLTGREKKIYRLRGFHNVIF
jgi:hypothetical protein